MEVPVIGELVRETKTRPYTMLLLTALAIGVPYIAEHAAWAEDVRQVQAQLSQLSFDQKKGNLEQRLQSVETDLFNIRQKIKEAEVAHRQIDSLYYARVNALEIEKEQLGRQLSALK